MKPGRELDALIAEKVMGEDVVELNHCSILPYYSTDIAAAWEVVEKMRSNYWKFSLKDAWSTWEAEFNMPTGKLVVYLEDTAPHAICLAALKAVGVEI